jgi:hypothetical protein
MTLKIKNDENLSVGDITQQMLEKRPLPIGRTQFEEWSNRIISGAMIDASTRSLKWALCEMVYHLAPTEAFKEDAHFILKLRKGAVNETCAAIMREIKAQHEEEKKLAEATAPKLEVVDGGSVENKIV